MLILGGKEIMRHRMGIAGCTGFGNPDKCLMDNQWSENEKLNAALKAMFDDAIGLYFSRYGGLDFQIELGDNAFNICMGYEPGYKYEKLNIININSNKPESAHKTGIAFGYYGSGIRSASKSYADYKKHSKFTRFIDKWYPLIQGAL